MGVPPCGRDGHKVTPVIPSDDLRTLVVATGRPERVPDAPLNTPIVAASSFVAGGPMDYARDDAPTSAAFEAAIGSLEGGHATAFSSGMAAANAVLDLLPMGAVVVAPRDAYTGTALRLRELADLGRIDLQLVDVQIAESVIAACSGATLLWLESPTNPLLAVADLATCIAGAREQDTIVLVDNTFATPMLQRPLQLGADVVLHSATKSLAGHSDLLLGALVVRDDALAERVRSRRVLLGAVPSAFDCFLALRGLRTLAVRVERAQENARFVVDRLADHPAVARVRYPGWGFVAAFEPAGDVAAADRICASTRIWTHATSLGGVESLLERRRRHVAESDLVPDTLIRLSFGIEAAEDLWNDLAAALDAATT